MVNNVLVLSEIFYPHGSGAELATNLYSKLLANSGVKVKVITNRYAGEPIKSENRNLTIYRLPLFKNEGNIKYLAVENLGVHFSEFFRNLVQWADVVYIPSCWYFAIPVVKAYGKSVVVHLHSYNLVCSTGSMYDISCASSCANRVCNPKCITTYEQAKGRRLSRVFMSTALNLTLGRCMTRLLEMSDKVICVSNAEKQLVLNRMPSLTKNIDVAYNPIPQINLSSIEGGAMGYFGGPSTLKGYNVILNALPHLQQVVIHATKFNKTPPLIAGNSRIVFHGLLSDEPYQRVYRQLSTVLVPSVWPETWGYVITEALLSGRVVIASPSGGIPEQISGLKGCFTFKSGDGLKLAESINYVRGLKKETLADLGIKNREGFLRKYNNVQVLKDFLGILDGACVD